MWLKEGRVMRDEDYRERWKGKEPLLDAHRQWNRSEKRVEGIRMERVGWMYARHGKWQGVGLDNSRCRCSQPRPDIAHWGWAAL